MDLSCDDGTSTVFEGNQAHPYLVVTKEQSWFSHSMQSVLISVVSHQRYHLFSLLILTFMYEGGNSA